MQYIDNIIISQIAPWQPNKKRYDIEKLFLWSLVNFIPIKFINFFLKTGAKSWNPYLQQNDYYKCIYIHIPKNAGISVQKILFPEYPNVGHRPLLYYKLYDENKFNNYFKFAFVRNPWDRLVSAYHFLLKGGLNSREPEAKRWAENLKNHKIKNFEHFVLSMTSPNFCKYFLNFRHLRPQYRWVIDEKERLALDLVVKVENFDQGIKKIKDRLKIQSSDEQIRLNTTNHENYKKLYTNEMKEIVGEYYKKDIEMFDYNFEGV